ncbi:hypothetical protein [Plantactinospora endophytica]|uniref:Immunity protein 35 domain-containing protein n=1 Tax=Plantactinospora endophytica TaxID=673535 RepID=A0ABQ4DY34_9ACTN|nr:hypothetical protein [Plantactinospora endophytica]GIG87370.1 hypothetical protein Pen02_23060 [Plantactinospora endophytica]
MSSEDPRWHLLTLAQVELLAHFADRGVERIEYIAAFPNFDYFTVWLCTGTDAEREALGTPNPAIDEVRQILRRTGFTAAQLTGLDTIAQSQETVDRDYESSWFYAMR